MTPSPSVIPGSRLSRMLLTPVSKFAWWASVLGASTAAYLIAVFVSYRLMAVTIMPDFIAGYYPGALGIQQGLGYVDEAGKLITRWPPGFSLFISPWVDADINETLRTLRHVSGFLAAVWVVIVAFLSRILVPRASLPFVLAVALFWPPLLAIGDPARSEMLFTVLITLGVFLLVKLYREPPSTRLKFYAITFVAWLAFLGATLTKTLGMPVIFAASIAIVFCFRNWSLPRRVGAIMIGAFVLSVGLFPWLMIYKKHTGHVGFVSNGFVSVRDGFQRHTSFPFGRKLMERSLHWDSLNDIRTDLRDISSEDPFGALHLIAIKIVRPWYGTWSKHFDRYIMIVQLPFLLLFALSSGRVLRRWSCIPGEVILLHGCVAALWLSAVIGPGLYRYLSPGFPFIVLVLWWHGMDLMAKGDLGPVIAHRRADGPEYI